MGFLPTLLNDPALYAALASSRTSRTSLLPTLLSAPPSPQWYWRYVDRRFRRFATGLEMTPNQLEDYNTKLREITQCLNRAYWPHLAAGSTDITWLVGGSWSKQTQARPGSDIDLIFLLPWEMRDRYQKRTGNKQSQILQEVKNVLIPSNPRTDIKGDGPTVVVDFSTVKIEVVPAFLCEPAVGINDINLRVQVCDTNDGGRYKIAAPVAERVQAQQANAASQGNFIALARMMRTWKRYCNVPVKSVALDQMIIAFLARYEYAKETPFWHDWMVRDFFAFMLTQKRNFALLPVSFEIIQFGDEWVSRAETAYKTACRACEHEKLDHNAEAGEEWQKIFGNFIAKEVV